MDGDEEDMEIEDNTNAEENRTASFHMRDFLVRYFISIYVLTFSLQQ